MNDLIDMTSAFTSYLGELKPVHDLIASHSGKGVSESFVIATVADTIHPSACRTMIRSMIEMKMVQRRGDRLFPVFN